MATTSSDSGAAESSGRQPSAGGTRSRLIRTLRWGVALGSVLALLALLPPLDAGNVYLLRKGELAPADIFSPLHFNVEDPVATERKVEQARKAVPPVLLERPEVEHVVDASLEHVFSLAIRLREEGGDPNDRAAVLHSQLLAETGVDLAPSFLPVLLFNADFRTYREDIRKQLHKMLLDGVVASPETITLIETRIDEGLGTQVMVRGDDGSLVPRFTTHNLRSVTDAVSAVRRGLERSGRYPTAEDVPRLQLAEELAEVLLRPNYVYLPQLTRQRREVAAEKVEPVMVRVRKGERIASEGESITERQAAVLKRLNELRGPQRPARWIGYLALALVPVFAVVGFLRRYHWDVLRSPANLLTLAFAVLMVLLLAKGAAALRLMKPEWDMIPYAIPVASVGILLTVLRSGRLALFMVHITAILCGIIVGTEWNLRFVLVLAWSSVIGIYGVTSIRKRTDPYRAGLWVSMTSVVLVLCLAIYDYPTWDEFVRNFHPHTLTALVAAAANGILSVGLAVLLLPLFEAVLGVTTDLRLLELAAGHQLLKRLGEQAPGSYHHSVMVATMAETAADAIGANGLLCRVGAMYHDIGKVESSKYFVENQHLAGEERSPHDRIKANMSVRIIRGHVKEGLELAREYGLPPVIQAFIPEHHGTTVLSYFYTKAVEEEGEENVRIDDFRYLGPKPQSVETAIVMIADTIEAASRTLDPLITEGQIMQFVRKAINEKFMDDQFDDCDLTLHQLHELAKSFTRSLSTIMHRRIVYPQSPQPARGLERSLDKDKETSPVEKVKRGAQQTVEELAAQDKGEAER